MYGVMSTSGVAIRMQLLYNYFLHIIDGTRGRRAIAIPDWRALSCMGSQVALLIVNHDFISILGRFKKTRLLVRGSMASPNDA